MAERMAVMHKFDGLKRCLRKKSLAMIIGMALVVPVQAQWLLGVSLTLPDPVVFANQMELGNVKQAQAWLDAGLPVDFMGSRIGSGLMIGAWEGNVPLMAAFLERGAQINLLNANGESALALAAWRGHKEAVSWLIERGAQINASGKAWSPLHYAVFGGHEGLVDQLLALGADINALTPNGSSVLMMAVYEGREGLARKLIDQGARRDVRNDWGDGALAWAMRNNNLNLAKLVSEPDDFQAAMDKPKESWGEAQRSLAMSKELEEMLSTRQRLAERKMSTEVIDRRIAAERVRLVRAQMDRPALQRATTLEVSASRQAREKQSVRLIQTPAKPPEHGMKLPPSRYQGTPKMPPSAPLRNY